MKEITFSVPFVKGLRRPQFNSYTRRAYDPDENVTRKAMIAYAFKTAKGYTPLLNDYQGEVRMRILAEAPLPVTKLKHFKSDPHTIKPDADNIAKLVLDGLNGIAYKDDSCVVALCIYKRPRTADSPLRTTVQICYPNFEEAKILKKRKPRRRTQ